MSGNILPMAYASETDCMCVCFRLFTAEYNCTKKTWGDGRLSTNASDTNWYEDARERNHQMARKGTVYHKFM